MSARPRAALVSRPAAPISCGPKSLILPANGALLSMPAMSCSNSNCWAACAPAKPRMARNSITPLPCALLALHRETAAQERAQQHNIDAATARRIIDGKLDELRQRVLARRIKGGETSA